MMDFKEFTTRAEQDIRAALEDASPALINISKGAGTLPAPLGFHQSD